MLKLITRIHINAGVTETWKVFSDFAKYPQWNPFIKRVAGKVGVGDRITVMLHQPGRKAIKMRPKVLVFDKEKELRWLGRVLLPGLFDGEHLFRLEKNADGSTSFIQEETFTGILVPFFRNMLERNTKLGFQQMNESLRDRVENRNGN